MSILVLVESPSKIKSISSYLGTNYEVMATMGHIRQLPKDGLGFDISNNYEPEFEIIPEKVDVVKKIKAKAKEVEKVVLCSDRDTEGESIAYHSAEVLKLPADKCYRATFNEITKKAVTTAITNTLANYTLIDMNIVYAQFARMILDKLIGYKVSPLLWKEYNNWHLSAGRVQSCLVKLVVERENDIASFASEPYFRLDAKFVLDKEELVTATSTSKFLITLCDNEIKDAVKVEAILAATKDASMTYKISSIGKNTTKRNPSPPYITSSLQQDASSQLGMSPDACMKTAQKLYEAGLITYMRTDATFMAEEAMKAIKICIENRWGETYYRRMVYKTKSASSQEGHEAIRCTDTAKESIFGVEGMTVFHNRLYQLIWRRTVASQMAPAEVEIRTVKIAGDLCASNDKQVDKIIFIGKHEKVLFPGYLACANLHKTKKATAVKIGEAATNKADQADDNQEDDNLDNDEDTNLDEQSSYLEKIFTKLKEGNQVWPIWMDATQKFTKPPHSRYTEASIIKKLDELGIGRPSTYASMIKKVQEEQRQYVERKSLPAKKVKITRMGYTYPNLITSETQEVKQEGDKNKLFPTSLGIMINEYLDKNFIDIINYQFTAQIESLLDEIAIGSKIWHRVVDGVYMKLNPIIDQLAQATVNRKAIQDAGGDTANRRLLGNHPESGFPVYAIKSRQGFLICESNPDKTKSRFASFTGRFDSITLEKAVELLIFPRTLGQYKSADVILKKAKNIYLAWNGKNYSIETYVKNHTNSHDNLEGEDPSALSLPNAIKILQYYESLDIQRVANAARDKILSPEITIKLGPYGAYIKYKGTDNIKLPKALKDKWETVTLEECLPVIEKESGKPKKASSARGRGAASSRARGGRGSGRGRGRGARGSGHSSAS